MSLSRKNLDHPVLVLIVFAILFALGIFTIRNVAVALMPETDNPYLMVSTSYPNAGPESVEKTVTQPIESALVSLNNLNDISSTSSEGSSTVSLEFNYGTDLDEAVQEIRDKLDRVKRMLPDNAGTPSIMRFGSNTQPIMRILVRGNRSVNDLAQIAEDTIIDVLEQADGVGEASVMGGRTAQVNVELEQNRMSAYGFTVSQVMAALSRQNLELGGGKVEDGGRNYVVRTMGEYTSIEDINNVIIATVNGYQVRLRDLGTATLGYADSNREAYINGEPGVYISITKQSGTNSVNVANAVYKKIDQVKKTLPSDMTLEIISDETEAIRDTISILIESLVEGLVLAVIVLFVFLQNFKSTLIIGISIPLSVVITLFAMSIFGITLNMMTLTGLILGIGMIVDASIVMIDNIYAYRQRGAKPKIAAILGSQEMVSSVLSGNLTTICVFIPFLFYMADLGMMGQMFKGIIFTIVIALLSSLAVAVFLVPVLAGKFLPLSNRLEKPVTNPVLKAIYGFFEMIIQAITKGYKWLLTLAMNNRLVTIVGAVCLLIISLALIPTMQINMGGGGGGDSSITVNLTMPIGTPLEQTKEEILKMEEICKSELRGYKNISTTIGGGRGSGGTNRGNIEVTIDTDDPKAMTAQEMQNVLRGHFAEFAGGKWNFRAGWGGSMFGSDFNIAIRSDDLEAAMNVADQIADVIDGLPECSEPSISLDKGLPQVEIVIDRERAYQFGVDVNTIANEIKYAIDGVTASVYRKGGKDYSIVIRYKPEDRKSLTNLENIYVRGNGGMVSVANFAKIEKGLGPVSISRENRTRIIRVTASNRSELNANVVEEKIKEGIANTFIIPDGVTVSYEGSWNDTMNNMKLFMGIIIMAILMVFGVMAATYESFKAPFINLVTIPFLIIGVLFLFKLTGTPISIISMVGVVMLVGIVVNNGIILVDYTNLLRARGIPMKEACIQAGVSRLRPVLMTTLTTILGMLPMCFATEGMSAFVQPIGMAVVGGLTSSTLVTLLVIPVVYSVVMRSKKDKSPEVKAVSDDADSKGEDEE